MTKETEKFGFTLIVIASLGIQIGLLLTIVDILKKIHAMLV